MSNAYIFILLKQINLKLIYNTACTFNRDRISLEHTLKSNTQKYRFFYYCRRFKQISFIFYSLRKGLFKLKRFIKALYFIIITKLDEKLFKYENKEEKDLETLYFIIMNLEEIIFFP